jgi:Phage capsid family
MVKIVGECALHATMSGVSADQSACRYRQPAKDRPKPQPSAMASGDFLVGSFGIAAQLVERTQAEVLISTEDNDNFRKNLVTLLCEERVALVVRRPQSFVFGNWPSGVT